MAEAHLDKGRGQSEPGYKVLLEIHPRTGVQIHRHQLNSGISPV